MSAAPRRLNFVPDLGTSGSTSSKSCQVNPSPHERPRVVSARRTVQQTRSTSPVNVVVAAILGLLVALSPRVGQRTAASPTSLPATLVHTLVASTTPVPAVPPTDDAVQLGARRLAIRSVARLRSAPDAASELAHGRYLYVHAVDPDLQELGLQVIVEHAAAGWPQGFRGRFLSGLTESVIRSAREHRVLPSVTLAQAILESGWGRSGLAANHHNLFGVKAGASDSRVRLDTREHSRGRLRPSRRSFRRYDSHAESIAHHARLLGEDRRYRRARAHWTDWREFLTAIAPRYASSPTYVDAVAEIVELYDLDRWDALIVDAAREDDARARS